MLRYYLYRAAAFVAPLLPKRLGYFLVEFGGLLAYRFAAKARAGATINARHVLGPAASEKKVQQTVRGMFLNAARNYFELFRLPKLDLARIDEVVHVVNYEHVARALQKGRGMVLVTGHCGNFNVVAQVLAARGVGLTVPVEPLEPPQLFALIRDLRASKGLSFLPLGPSTMRALLRTLREGSVVAVTADRDIQKNGRPVRFFGKETTLPAGYLELANRAESDLVMAFAVRQADNTFLGSVEPAIKLQKTGNREKDLDANLTKVVAVLEKYISAHPDQWAVFEPVWPE